VDDVVGRSRADTVRREARNGRFDERFLTYEADRDAQFWFPIRLLIG